MAKFFDDIQFILSWVNKPLFNINGHPVTFGGICAGILIFLATLIVSAIVQRAVGIHLKRNPRLSHSVIYAMRRIIHYAFIVLGFLLAAQCVGLDLGTLAVAFGFLGVGIGFGLQNITANFVSGLILLIERPIGIGDFVDINGKVAEVLNINMRSTTVRTFDNVTIIVPNSTFIENDVINWSIEDPRIRIHCPVGVAYGSDTAKVKEILLNVARGNTDVLETPTPEVRFLEFGDSSLNFDLLVWTAKPENQKILRSNINFAIDQAFRDNDIRIPFPQRDVHIQMTPAMEVLSGRLPRTKDSTAN